MENVLVASRKFLLDHEKIVFRVAIGLALFLVSLGTYWFLPLGIDWANTYRPAAREVLSLRSPYNIAIYHSPPWSVIPILPLALLPERIGYGINFSLAIAATAFVAYRLGAKPMMILVLLFSYPILFMASYGQVDWLIYLGFLLPPKWGLFLVLIKPQISIGLVIYWFIQALREGGIKKAAVTFLPVSIALLLSFLVFGNWFQSSFTETGKIFNASLWPQSIPIGIVILITAVRQRSVNLAIIASPFLSPNLAPHGWGVALLALSPYTLELFAASLGFWILRLMTDIFLR